MLKNTLQVPLTEIFASPSTVRAKGDGQVLTAPTVARRKHGLKGIYIIILLYLPVLSYQEESKFVGTYAVGRFRTDPVFLPFSRSATNVPEISKLRYIMSVCHQLNFKPEKITGTAFEQEMFKASGFEFQRTWLNTKEDVSTIISGYLPPNKAHFLTVSNTRAALSRKKSFRRIVRDKDFSTNKEHTFLLSRGPVDSILSACSEDSCPSSCKALVQNLTSSGFGVQGCAFKKLDSSADESCKSQELPLSMEFCGLIVSTSKPYSVAELPTAPFYPSTQEAWVQDWMVDYEAMVRTVLCVAFESLLCLGLAFFDEIRRGSLTFWSLVVFVIPGLTGRFPPFPSLIWGKRLVRPTDNRAEMYRSFRKPGWAPSMDLMYWTDIMARAGQTYAIFLGWEKMRKTGESGLLLGFLITQALYHAWKRIFFDHGELGYSLTLIVFVLLGALTTCFKFSRLDRMFPLYLYLPAVLEFSYKALLNLMIWKRNGQMAFVPMTYRWKRIDGIETQKDS